MKKMIWIGTLVSFGLAVVFSFFCFLGDDRNILPFVITFWTTFYHFLMRMITGYAVMGFRKRWHAADRKTFSVGKAERSFYRLIRLKQWKQYAPTYQREMFAVSPDAFPVLYHNIINAQIGHEIMVLLSFLPLLLSKALDGFVPFLITSVLAALFDFQFVMIQRYNRDRVSRLLDNTGKTVHFDEIQS